MPEPISSVADRLHRPRGIERLKSRTPCPPGGVPPRDLPGGTHSVRAAGEEMLRIIPLMLSGQRPTANSSSTSTYVTPTAQCVSGPRPPITFSKPPEALPDQHGRSAGGRRGPDPVLTVARRRASRLCSPSRRTLSFPRRHALHTRSPGVRTPGLPDVSRAAEDCFANSSHILGAADHHVQHESVIDLAWGRDGAARSGWTLNSARAGTAPRTGKGARPGF